MSDKVHQCQHCGKFSSKDAKYIPSSAGGTGSTQSFINAEENAEVPDGGNDDDNAKPESAAQEKADLNRKRTQSALLTKMSPTQRAQMAVKSRLKEFKKREGVR